MKRVILLAAVVLGMMSCTKENPTSDCNCGIITDDGIDGNCYYVVIRNNCSGNERTFCLSSSDWFTAFVGTNYCITNVSSWKVDDPTPTVDEANSKILEKKTNRK